MMGIGYQELLLLWPLFGLWVVGSLVVGYVAGQKDRNPLWGTPLSLLFITPLLALIALAALPNRGIREDDEVDARSTDEISSRIRRR